MSSEPHFPDAGAVMRFFKSGDKGRLQTGHWWLYFLLAYSWTWLWWISAALLSQSGPGLAVTVLHYLGGLGPLLACTFLLFVSGTVKTRRDFWQRITDFRRIPFRWYLVIFLTLPVITGLSALFDWLFRGGGLQLAAAADLIAAPLRIVPFTLFILMFGPLVEEVGWRGYALERMPGGVPSLASSLLLGVLWGGWHMPLFFIQGSYQHGLGVGSLLFWLYLMAFPLQSIVYTWIFQHTGRSTLSAILFHFMNNYTGELIDLSLRGEVFAFLLFALFAGMVVWMNTRSGHFRLKPADTIKPTDGLNSRSGRKPTRELRKTTKSKTTKT